MWREGIGVDEKFNEIKSCLPRRGRLGSVYSFRILRLGGIGSFAGVSDVAQSS